jgi:ADP-ribosylglycohydrolase
MGSPSWIYCNRSTALPRRHSPAVNHSGDSDSTRSIAGKLLGLIHGVGGIPEDWLQQPELRDVVERMARDLWSHFGPAERGPCDDLQDYPSW